MSDSAAPGAAGEAATGPVPATVIVPLAVRRPRAAMPLVAVAVPRAASFAAAFPAADPDAPRAAAARRPPSLSTTFDAPFGASPAEIVAARGSRGEPAGATREAGEDAPAAAEVAAAEVAAVEAAAAEAEAARREGRRVSRPVSFKRAVLSEVDRPGAKLSVVARRFSVPPATLRGWVRDRLVIESHRGAGNTCRPRRVSRFPGLPAGGEAARAAERRVVELAGALCTKERVTNRTVSALAAAVVADAAPEEAAAEVASMSRSAAWRLMRRHGIGKPAAARRRRRSRLRGAAAESNGEGSEAGDGAEEDGFRRRAQNAPGSAARAPAGSGGRNDDGVIALP